MTVGKSRSQGQDTALYQFSTLGLPSGRGPDSLFPCHAEHGNSPRLCVNWRTENHCAAQPCRGLLPTGVCVPHRHLTVSKAQDTAPFLLQSLHVAVTGMGPWRKCWVAATVPTPAFLQRCSNTGRRRKMGQPVTRKARSCKERARYWPRSSSLIWASGVELDWGKEKMPEICLFHIPHLSTTQFLKQFFFIYTFSIKRQRGTVGKHRI